MGTKKSSELLFAGHGWKFTLDSAPLPDGRVKQMARAHRCDSVHILAFPTDETILLIREYRPHYGEWIWMLPSGKVDKEDDPDQAAHRELREETGNDTGTLHRYFSMCHMEGLNAAAHVYIARGLRSDPLPQDASELIETHELRQSEAIERVQQSPLIHAVSLATLLRYARENGY